MTVIWFSKMLLPVIILKEDLDLFVAVINRGQNHNSLPARLSGQFEVIWGHWSHCHQSQLVSFMWASLEISSNMYYLFLLYRSWTCWTDIGKGWYNVVDFLLLKSKPVCYFRQTYLEINDATKENPIILCFIWKMIEAHKSWISSIGISGFNFLLWCSAWSEFDWIRKMFRKNVIYIVDD